MRQQLGADELPLVLELWLEEVEMQGDEYDVRIVQWLLARGISNAVGVHGSRPRGESDELELAVLGDALSELEFVGQNDGTLLEVADCGGVLCAGYLVPLPVLRAEVRVSHGLTQGELRADEPRLGILDYSNE